jgi:hypothetical protein
MQNNKILRIIFFFIEFFLFVRPFIPAVFIAMVIYAMSNCLDILVMSEFDIDSVLTCCAIIPIKSYSDVEVEKAKIFSENRGKSGVYC